MAGIQNTSSVGTRRFDKDLNEDVNDFHLPENSWTQARNAINNSITGDLGKLGNEPSNLFCTKTPYPMIGVIHLIADTWAVFSTDNIDSEIGIFQEDQCKYTTVVNDRCLAFSQDHLIKGVSRATSTCTFKLYWDDGFNVSRSMPLTIDSPEDNVYTNPNSPVPWIQSCNIIDSCNICTNTPALDCEKIRLARFIQTPCIDVENGVGNGTLLNGSYIVAIAYAIDGQKISDWFISNVQPVFNHNNAACSIDVNLSNVDQDFDQLQVAIISVTNQQVAARLAGVYSTRQQRLSFDTIDNTWPAVAIEEFPIMTPIANKTDAMYNVNEYLLRVGPTSKEDFNYQPLANQIVTKWQSVEYPTSYYRKGGNKTNYLRDEVYPFFIRWVFDTGDKSASYHIPGRPGGTFSTLGNDWLVATGSDTTPEAVAGLTAYNWVVYNTAVTLPPPGSFPLTLPDGGVVIEEGLMGYWESTERYDDSKPQIWDANIPVSPYSLLGFTLTNDFGVPLPITGTAHNLCGKPIRHHRFPDMGLSFNTEYLSPTQDKIRIMAIKFDNIQAPLMNDGITPVPGIVGYEILRGARNGNKTVLAKGLLNNMREYDIPDEGNSPSPTTGLFPNYPYNELGRPDPFLSTTEVSGPVCSYLGGVSTPESYNGQTRYSQRAFTFHSPETNFTDPFLAAKEIKIHGEMNGDVIGKFEKSEEHPKEKLITNATFIIGAIAGIGIAAIAMNGKRSTHYRSPNMPGFSSEMPLLTAWSAPYGIGSATVSTWSKNQPANADALGLIGAAQTFVNSGYSTWDTSHDNGLGLLQNIVGLTDDSLYSTMYSTWALANSTTDAFSSRNRDIMNEDGQMKSIPAFMRVVAGIPLFFNYWTQGTDEVLELLRALISYRDFVLRYHSHAYYNRYLKPQLGNTRRVITEEQYLGPQITGFGLNKRVNNLYRSKTVAIKIAEASDYLPTDPWYGLVAASPITDPQVNDVTRIRAASVDALYELEFASVGGSAFVLKDPTRRAFGRYDSYGGLGGPISPGNAGSFIAGHSGIQIASSHYVSLKQRIRNQYGQINGVIQVLTASCTMTAPTQDQPTDSDTIFGGDTYLGRYTEKNTFFFFYNWLYGQPDGAQFDYTRNEMIPYPRFWGNFDQFETGDFMSSLGGIISGGGFGSVILPNDYYSLDGWFCPSSWLSADTLRMSVRYAWMYLFNSGVKDFYVESEINVDLRDWGPLETEQHYDPYRYNDTKALFDTKIIKAGNYYKYDQSLSIAKLFINYASWGSVQPINYNPFIAETCFVYNPTRLIYSLPSQFESTRDNWYIFLANNYFDFDNNVTCIKPINKSGAFIFFDAAGPVQFLGQDQLQTTAGTKLTIGDGGLFSQPMQNISNTDRPYEYGSCQDRLSVINTPAGVFWMSQNQGKIFQFQGGLIELSMQDLKWWFATYLPYKLTESFNNFELKDNPVIGIGCQSMYDNENGLIYFTKKDYVLLKDVGVYDPNNPLAPGVVLNYLGSNNFSVVVNGVANFDVILGDPRFFENASWTISYDPKTKGWLSYHDWHPDLTIAGKNTFLTIKNVNSNPGVENGIWIHNKRCDSYCNYYGFDYPFEVEYMVNTVQTVNTLRSIEYILEVYKYDTNCYDRFHVLDYNFDEAVIFNTEQVSGMLNLVLEPKNDPQGLLPYPIINFNSIDVLFAKVENKYRFNQFWDITADRGEYNPSAQRMIWNTGANGYVRTLNPNNLDYTKDEFQRKKFRHYTNSVFLRRKVSGDRKMLVLLTNNKDLYSPR